MKSHLRARMEADNQVLQKYLGRDIPKMFMEWERATNDPTVRIVPASQMFPISQRRIGVCKIALRIMQNFKVGTEYAHRYARACGHDGEVAFRVEDYDAILGEKWGPQCAFFKASEFERELTRRGRRLALPESGFETTEMQSKYYDCIRTLRAALWGFECFDIPAETAMKWMQAFKWSNMWKGIVPPGVVAFEIEDYASRSLTRRESARK